jgi:hypothetical protein
VKSFANRRGCEQHVDRMREHFFHQKLSQRGNYTTPAATVNTHRGDDPMSPSPPQDLFLLLFCFISRANTRATHLRAFRRRDGKLFQLFPRSLSLTLPLVMKNSRGWRGLVEKYSSKGMKLAWSRTRTRGVGNFHRHYSGVTYMGWL